MATIWQEGFGFAGAWEAQGDVQPGPGTLGCISNTCDWLLRERWSLRFPIHDVPANNWQTWNRLRVRQTQPGHGSLGREHGPHYKNFVAGHQIEPVKVVTTDPGTGLPLDPYTDGFKLTGLYNDLYLHTGDQKVNCIEPRWPCGLQTTALQRRKIMPILRIVDWLRWVWWQDGLRYVPRWQIRLDVTGSIPAAVDYTVNPIHDIARVAFSVAHTHSWSEQKSEINLDESLWGFEAEPGDYRAYCHLWQEGVGFQLFANVVYCDQLLNMWMIHPFDELYMWNPYALAWIFCCNWSWSFSDPRLFAIDPNSP